MVVVHFNQTCCVHSNSRHVSGAPPDLGVVGSLLDDLWCHPEGGADERVPLQRVTGQLSGHAKISQFHVPRL